MKTKEIFKTTYGNPADLADLALDAIYKLRLLGLEKTELHKFEDRWLSLVRVPGGSHFPSRSS